MRAWCAWLGHDKLQILRQGNNAIRLTYKTLPTLSVKNERHTKRNFDGNRAYSVQYNVYIHIHDGLSHPNAALIQTFAIFIAIFIWWLAIEEGLQRLGYEL